MASAAIFRAIKFGKRWLNMQGKIIVMSGYCATTASRKEGV
jgi:hypothetical protein